MDRIPEVHSMSCLVSLLREKCGQIKNSSSYHFRECVPEVWTKIGEAAQKRETQEWVMEKQNRQRSKVERHFLYELVDEHKRKPQMRRKLEFSMESAILRKKKGQWQKHTHRVRLKKARAYASTRFPKRSMHVPRNRISLRDNVLQSSHPKNHEDKIGGKGKT